MDVDDNKDVAAVLFDLANIIIQSTISRNKVVTDVYKKLLKKNVDAINKRDKKLS